MPETAVAAIRALTLPGTAKHVHAAREFVATALAERPCRESAVLLTSELVANSIVHSTSGQGGEVTVIIIDLGMSVRIEVIDEGSDHLPIIQDPAGALDDSGRGLHIVATLAGTWGHFRDEHGLTTWFEIPDFDSHARGRHALPPGHC